MIHKKRIIGFSLVIVGFFVFLSFSFTVQKANAVLPGVDLDIMGVQRMIIGIACWSINTILAVMVIALIVAGIRFYIGGAAGNVASAKKNFLWVLVGIAVILATNIIIATIAYFLGATYQAFTC